MSLMKPEKYERITTLADQTILIYGKPKAGKSTLASCFDDVLYVATEDGYKHLNLDYTPQEVTTWEEFEAFGKELYTLYDSSKKAFKDGFPYKTLVIDTIDNLNTMAERYVCKREGIDALGDLAMGKAYGMVRQLLKDKMDKLSMLPMGLVLISHSVSKDVEMKHGLAVKSVTQQDISITGNRGKDFKAMADIIIYMTSKINDEGKEVGCSYFKPSIYHEAGDRSKLLPESIQYDPAKIEQLYKQIADKFSAK